MILAALDPALVALTTAILTGLAGMITAVAGILSARHRGDEDCVEKLRLARREGEDAAAELHKMRMEKFTQEIGSPKEIPSGEIPNIQ